jgi:O-antigen/teichoic acid export membrane protein
VTVVNNSVVLLLLGYYQSTTAVAYYRVVLPAAALNTLIMTGFSMLYTPSAARLFANNDNEGINRIYWQTAVWMGATSFPIFAVTFCFARPLTVFLYGHRYEQSAIILALLSLGNFVSVVSGFNGITLKVVGKLKYMVTINIIAALSTVVFSLLLIPRYGVFGGAISATGAMVLHNALKQAGLRFIPGVHVFQREYTTFYLFMAFSSAGLFLLQFVKMPIQLVLLLAAVASLLVLAASRKVLRIGYMFPEVQKIPLMGRFFV